MARNNLTQTYAQAIYDQAVEGWRSTLRTFSTALADSELVETLDNASTKFSRKEEILNQVLPAGAPEHVRNFIKLLASKNHLHLLPEIVAEFDRRVTQVKHQRVARVTSAVELKRPEKSALEKQMRARFGMDTTFEYTVNPDILGGIIIRVGDQVLDGSVAGQLAAMKEKLAA